MKEHIMDFFELTEFDFDCPNGIEDTRINTYTLAPNPSIGKMFLHNKSLIPLIGNIKITSLTGTEYYHEDNINLQKGERYYFDFSNLPNNTYILTFYNESIIEKKKVIILH